MEVRTNNHTHYKDCPSMSWTPKHWYKFIMKHAREAIADKGSKYYYPVYPFMENKDKQRRLEAELGARYDDLIAPLIEGMPETTAMKLVKRVQQYEMAHLIKMLSFLVCMICICGGIMFWNYHRWKIENLGSITLGFMLFSIAAVPFWYLMNKMIRDAIIRACSAIQKQPTH